MATHRGPTKLSKVRIDSALLVCPFRAVPHWGTSVAKAAGVSSFRDALFGRIVDLISTQRPLTPLMEVLIFLKCPTSGHVVCRGAIWPSHSPRRKMMGQTLLHAADYFNNFSASIASLLEPKFCHFVCVWVPSRKPVVRSSRLHC
jgi:hypothetical protein